MSNDLTDAREHLATLVRAALGENTATTVDSYVPEELAERHVVIQLPANALKGDQMLAGACYTLSLEVYLLLAGLDNAEVHAAVDDYLARVIPAVHASTIWRLEPGSLSNVVTVNTAQGDSPGIKFTATAALTITQE